MNFPTETSAVKWKRKTRQQKQNFNLNHPALWSQDYPQWLKKQYATNSNRFLFTVLSFASIIPRTQSPNSDNKYIYAIFQRSVCNVISTLEIVISSETYFALLCFEPVLSNSNKLAKLPKPCFPSWTQEHSHSSAAEVDEIDFLYPGNI